MYALVIVIAVTSIAFPVGVASHIVGHFDNVDQCKEAASKPIVGGAIVDLNLSQAVYWHCVYVGSKR